MIIRLPVSAETCTVLGNKVKETDPAWMGLDLDNADVCCQSTLMLAISGKDAPIDLHLNAPWWHPDDGPAPHPPEMYYRVRPRAEEGGEWNGETVRSVAFERWGGKWWIAIEVDARRKGRRK